MHIGELIQFLTLVKLCKEDINFTFVLFLCGKSTNPPKVKTESSRLKYFFNQYSLTQNERNKIKGIHITEQPETLELELNNIENYYNILN